MIEPLRPLVFCYRLNNTDVLVMLYATSVLFVFSRDNLYFVIKILKVKILSGYFRANKFNKQQGGKI